MNLHALAFAAALAVGSVFGCHPVLAEAPACMTPDRAQAEIADKNGGIKPAAILRDKEARDFAEQAGRADGTTLVYLLYVHEGRVFIFEFADGCFRTQGAMPVEVFRLMYPGVLPEDK